MPNQEMQCSAVPLEMNPLTASMGGPDVAHILIHCIASIPNPSALQVKLPAMDYYPERALLMARPQDVVCVNYPVNCDYVGFLAGMGIGPREENIIACSHVNDDTPDLPSRLLTDPPALRNIADRVRGFERIVLHPLYASHRMFELGNALSQILKREVEIIGGNPDTVYNANRKHLGKAMAIELDIPVAPGELVELNLLDGEFSNLSDLHSAIERQVQPTGMAIIRGASGSSGSATFLAGRDPESIASVVNAIAARKDNLAYLVEVCFKNIVSPNIQAFVDAAGTEIAPPCATDQLLDSHLNQSGNAYPSKARTLPQMLDGVCTLAARLRSEGFTGTIGFDCVEYADPETGERKWFLAEINPRINSAAYPTALMHRLNKDRAAGDRIKAFHAVTLKTSVHSFEELRKQYGHTFFDPASGRGMFPYNIGCLAGGSFGAVFLGASRDDVEEMAEGFAY